MSKIQSAVAWAVGIASDSSHGYAQDNRWGPDYDCSSLVISAWEHAGVPVKTKGATYTGNMKKVFLACGFKDVTAQVNRASGAGLQTGDVLLHEQNHTAMFIGAGRIVHASINERGGIKNGTPGDQTGGEICTRGYYNFPWGVVLRYPEDGETAVAVPIKMCTIEVPQIQYGDVGDPVEAMQYLLMKSGFGLPNYGPDGEYGDETGKSLKAFQKSKGLTQDGICGKDTWSALIGT